MFTALAVDTFALPPQDRDRSDSGVLDSPTLSAALALQPKAKGHAQIIFTSLIFKETFLDEKFVRFVICFCIVG